MPLSRVVSKMSCVKSTRRLAFANRSHRRPTWPRNRWARANGTFGEDADIAKRMAEAYVTGLQNGADGLNEGSVVAVVKHWVGTGGKGRLGWS
jgi:hypothetical protein